MKRVICWLSLVGAVVAAEVHSAGPGSAAPLAAGEGVVELRSDGQTWVSIEEKVLLPRQFRQHTISLPPGTYEVVGRRTQFRDVRLPVQVRGGAAPVALTVVCTERSKL